MPWQKNRQSIAQVVLGRTEQSTPVASSWIQLAERAETDADSEPEKNQADDSTEDAESGVFSGLKDKFSLDIERGRDDESGQTTTTENLLKPFDLPVAAIRFEGNDKTRDGVLRNELYIQPGEVPTVEKIEESRQSMMNLGLFNAVDARVERVSGGQDVVFTVKEKRWYVLPVPRGHYNQDGDASIGLELEWANFMGLNHTWTTSIDRDISTAEEDRGNGYRIRSNYRWPAVSGTRLNLDFGGSFSDVPVTNREPDNSIVEHDELDQRAYINFGYRLTGQQTTGWSVFAGPFYWRRVNKPASPNAVEEGGTSLIGRAGIRYNDIRFNLYSERGIAFRTGVANSLPLDSNDFEFTEWSAGFSWLTPGLSKWLDSPHHNFNFLASFGVGSGGPPRFDHFGLTSGVVRAYDTDDAEGAAYAEATLEYLAPIFGIKSLRWYSFVDVGNVWPDRRDASFSDLRSSIGAGIRWRLIAFVNFELDLGIAYGLDNREYEVLAGSNRF